MRVKLSKADRTILAHLEWNARITEKELSHKTNLSKDGVRYRIRRLEHKGVITGYSAMIDYKRLGKESHKLYLKTTPTREAIDAIKELFTGRDDVFAIFESRGNWNLAIALFEPTTHDYYKIENELLDKHGDDIIEKHICQMVDATITTGKAIDPDMPLHEHPLWQHKESHDLDETDKAILEALSDNAKATLQTLADKTGKSLDTVMRKRKRLEQEGIIPLYSTTINYPAIGLDIYKVFIHVKTYNHDTERKMITHLKTEPSLRNIIRMIGPWKLEAELTINRYEEYEAFAQRLSEAFPDTIADMSFSIFRNEEFHPQ